MCAHTAHRSASMDATGSSSCGRPGEGDSSRCTRSSAGQRTREWQGGGCEWLEGQQCAVSMPAATAHPGHWLLSACTAPAAYPSCSQRTSAAVAAAEAGPLGRRRKLLAAAAALCVVLLKHRQAGAAWEGRGSGGRGRQGRWCSSTWLGRQGVSSERQNASQPAPGRAASSSPPAASKQAQVRSKQKAGHT